MSFECITHIHNHPGSKNNLPLKRVSVPCQVYPDGIFQDAYRPVRQNISQQWQRCKIAKNIAQTVHVVQDAHRVILVNMEISVILGHEKTIIRNIIDYGKIDVFSVRTIIHIKNKMMGHLI